METDPSLIAAHGRPCFNGRSHVKTRRTGGRSIPRRVQSSGHSVTGWEPGSEQVFCREKRYCCLVYLLVMEDLLNYFKSRIHFVSIKQVKLGVYLQFLLFYCWNFIQESEPRQSLHAPRPPWPLWVKERQCTITAWNLPVSFLSNTFWFLFLMMRSQPFHNDCDNAEG